MPRMICWRRQKSECKKLEKYYNPIIGAEVYLRLEYDEHKENKKVELKLNIPR